MNNTEPRGDEHYVRLLVGMAKAHGALTLQIDLAAAPGRVESVIHSHFTITFAGRRDQAPQQDVVAWLRRQSLGVDLQQDWASKARENAATWRSPNACQQQVRLPVPCKLPRRAHNARGERLRMEGAWE